MHELAAPSNGGAAAPGWPAQPRALQARGPQAPAEGRGARAGTRRRGSPPHLHEELVCPQEAAPGHPHAHQGQPHRHVEQGHGCGRVGWWGGAGCGGSCMGARRMWQAAPPLGSPLARRMLGRHLQQRHRQLARQRGRSSPVVSMPRVITAPHMSCLRSPAEAPAGAAPMASRAAFSSVHAMDATEGAANQMAANMRPRGSALCPTICGRGAGCKGEWKRERRRRPGRPRACPALPLTSDGTPTQPASTHPPCAGTS